MRRSGEGVRGGWRIGAAVVALAACHANPSATTAANPPAFGDDDDPAPRGCGGARWAVRTGSDLAATAVDVDNLTPSTIDRLRAAAAERRGGRHEPFETTVYLVDAWLTGLEPDGAGGMRLTLSDAKGRSLAAAVPGAGCLEQSAWKAIIDHARTDLKQALGDAGSAPLRRHVIVAAPGFFDAAAREGAALSPVLGVVFFDEPATARDARVRR